MADIGDRSLEIDDIPLEELDPVPGTANGNGAHGVEYVEPFAFFRIEDGASARDRYRQPTDRVMDGDEFSTLLDDFDQVRTHYIDATRNPGNYHGYQVESRTQSYLMYVARVLHQINLQGGDLTEFEHPVVPIRAALSRDRAYPKPRDRVFAFELARYVRDIRDEGIDLRQFLPAEDFINVEQIGIDLVTAQIWQLQKTTSVNERWEAGNSSTFEDHERYWSEQGLEAARDWLETLRASQD